MPGFIRWPGPSPPLPSHTVGVGRNFCGGTEQRSEARAGYLDKPLHVFFRCAQRKAVRHSSLPKTRGVCSRPILCKGGGEGGGFPATFRAVRVFQSFVFVRLKIKKKKKLPQSLSPRVVQDHHLRLELVAGVWSTSRLHPCKQNTTDVGVRRVGLGLE